MNDTPEHDTSEYTSTGFRDGDARQGFGDDGGTRVGRPDGAGSNASPQDPNGSGRQAGGSHAGGTTSQERLAPHDTQGPPRPGQAGTNTGPVVDGIEGSELDGVDAQGPQQSRLQAASQGIDDGPAAGDERRTDDL